MTDKALAEASVMLAVSAFLCAVWLVKTLRPFKVAQDLFRWWMRLPLLGFCVIGLFFADCALRASEKYGALTNIVETLQSVLEQNAVPPGEGDCQALSSGPRMSTNQYAAGFALVGAATNAAPWTANPETAILHSRWALRGAAEDTFWLPATNWSFVLGTNAVDGAHVSSDGTLSFGRPKGSPRAAGMPDRYAVSFLAPLHGRLGVALPEGRFWHAVTGSNSVLMTWQDVYAGRDTNSPVTVQAELFWNGDFVYRYAFTNAPSLTNFVVGAQHNGGGETYALNAPGLLANGLELRWRAFGLLDPGIDDHDGDGLSTYDEVMLHGTDPALKDSDRDGLEDAAETAAHTDPLDPDTDGDGLADGTDPRPSDWDDPDGDADGDGLGFLYEVTHGLDPASSDAADSDGDNWADWKERMAGTETDNPYSTPLNADGSCGLFDVAVTLNASLPCDALLSVGGKTLVLRQAGSRTLTLAEGVAYPVSVCASRPCAVSLSVTLGSQYAAFQNRGAVFSGGADVPGGVPVACGVIAQPVPGMEPDPVCFHSGAPKSLCAKTEPPMAGTFQWWWDGAVSSPTGHHTNIRWSPDASGVTVLFTAEGASGARSAYRGVTRCARFTEWAAWCEVHGCEHWLCACDDAEASPDDWCRLHGRPVSVCRVVDLCPKHGCPRNECPRGWCHAHDVWLTECERFYCHACGLTLSACDCGRQPTESEGQGGIGWETVSLVSGEGAAAVNNDDDDADGTADLSPSPVAGENDLAGVYPLGPYDGQCCPCPEHRASGAESAELESVSARLALWADAGKAAAFDETVGAGQQVWVEGLAPSPAVNADRVVWKWTDENEEVRRATNAFTVLSVRLFGDVNLDGQVNAGDRALHPALTNACGWAMPASTNVCRPVLLRTDVGLQGGAYTLSLSGTNGAFRVWPDASGTNAAPLLECGQTVTNGVDGVSFLSGADSDLFVEAVGNGIATLTYAYAGTGAASNLFCSAAMKMTAVNTALKLDVNGDGDMDDAVDGLANYLPGYEGTSAKITWGEDGSYAGAQGMKIALEGGASFPPDAVTFEIVETTSIPGFCMNSASGGTEDDYSFSASGNSRGPVQGTMSGNLCATPFYCKDFGGWCRVRVAFKNGGAEVFSQTFTLPADTNGNQIADVWPGDAINGTAPGWDGETTFHGSDGDGLTRMEEYRGFLVQNIHERLSVVDKELFIHRANASYAVPVAFAASVAVIKDITEDEMNGADFDDVQGSRNSSKTPRIVNFQYDPAWHKVDQHGLWLLVNDDGFVPEPGTTNIVNGTWGMTVDRMGDWGHFTSCPAKTGCVNVYTKNIMKDCVMLSGSNFCWDASTRTSSLIEETIAHELGHGVGIDHHSPASWTTVATVNYSQSGRWDVLQPLGEVTFHGGDTSCLMRYVFTEIRAAICGDLNFNGSPCEAGESPDADWTPTVPGRPGFCDSGDNCLSQIVIDDSDGN